MPVSTSQGDKVYLRDSVLLENPKLKTCSGQFSQRSKRVHIVNSLYNICKFMAPGESLSGIKATAEGFSHCVVTPYVLPLNKNQILQNEVIIY